MLRKALSITLLIIVFCTNSIFADWGTYRNDQGRSAYATDTQSSLFVLSYLDGINISSPGINMSQPVKVGVGCYV